MWPVVVSMQVRRLEIAVDDARGVRGGQRIGDLGDEPRRLCVRQGSSREPRRQRLALVVRYGDERLAVRVADFVDRPDVRVIERARRARFAQEPCRRFGGARPGIEELERDPALQLRVLREVDGAHSARPEVTLDAVMRHHASDHRRVVAHTPPSAVSVAVSGVKSAIETDYGWSNASGFKF